MVVPDRYVVAHGRHAPEIAVVDRLFWVSDIHTQTICNSGFSFLKVVVRQQISKYSVYFTVLTIRISNDSMQKDLCILNILIHDAKYSYFAWILFFCFVI